MVVGLPLTLRGERGEQAQATEAFVDALRGRLSIPVETYDERFTTTLAEQGGGNASSADFEALAMSLSGQDLSSFFTAWLRTPSRPEPTEANGLA